MAQTKKKRQTKHRGNAAGAVEVRGRTSRPPSPEAKKRQAKETARVARLSREPTWKISLRNAGLMAGAIFIFLLVVNRKHGGPVSAALVAVLAFVLYTPGAYYMERYMWKRRLRGAPASETKRGR